MTTRTYRLDHDLGFAPNPFFGWCSLACCMANIRQYAAIGDIIIGMAGSGAQGLGRYHPQLIYWMRVEEALSFNAYWDDPRFARKRPQIPGPKMRMVGDRTYRRAEDGVWCFDTSLHFVRGAPQGSGGHIARDTKTDRVLVGRAFTYWGNKGPAVPAQLLSLFPSRRGQKCPRDPQMLAALHDLIDIERPRGLVGDPADWDNPRYFRKI